MSARVKPGTSKASAQQRLALFVEALMENSGNATAAALKVGASERSAHVIGCRWMKEPFVQKLLEKRRAEERAKWGLTTDRVMLELARVTYFNPKRLFREDGSLKAIHELDDDTAAALAAIETESTPSQVTLTRFRPFDKVSAIEKGVRILRLYDKPPPPPTDETPATLADPRETARRMAFLLARGAAATEKAALPQPQKPRKKTIAAV